VSEEPKSASTAPSIPGPDETIVATARAWADILAERDLTTEERERFEAWVCEHPVHESELLAALEIPIRLEELPESERERLRAREAPPVATARYLQERSLWSAPRLAVAAGIVLLAIGGAWFILSRHPDYSTATGERLNTSLPDGTHVELNTQTDLQWLGRGRCDRRVRLLRGEVLFEVHSDPRCPFQVLTGGGSIEVLGTRFDVYRHGDGNEQVSVLDGRVRVRGSLAGSSPWEVDVGAGEQATWGMTAGPPSPRPLDNGKATAWREGLLEFQNEPLGQVIGELQRYTSLPIKIADERLFDIHVTGRVELDSSHIHEFLLRLRERPEIRVRADDRSVTLSYRSAIPNSLSPPPR
jgi:transmembrane sensor